MWRGLIIKMYRSSVAFLLCLSAALSAPRDNSDITYVKIQPITNQDAASPPHASLRESRIENLPLTIGSFHEESVRRIRSEDPAKVNEDPEIQKDYVKISNEDANVRSEDEKILSEDPKFGKDPKIGNEDPKLGKEDPSTSPLPETSRATNTYEDLELRTESIKVPQIPEATKPEPKFYEKQIPGPRFYSKLSYFSKPNGDSDSSLSTNLVSARVGGRRKFRSRCRCERIWNCPKLQITVPRCPEEYFLCCF